jgi:hypothetical protein
MKKPRAFRKKLRCPALFLCAPQSPVVVLNFANDFNLVFDVMADVAGRVLAMN